MNATFTPAILIHLGAAVAALLLGFGIFVRRKGSFTHRVLGRIWAGLMLVTAISTYWIRSDGSFSWIHGLSVATLIALAGGITLAVKGNITRHRRVMGGLYFGALIIAGGFAFLPERLLGKLLWSSMGML